MPKSSHRCTNCARIHRKCGREIPTCEQCIKKGLQCVYLVKNKYINRLHTLQDSVGKFKLNNDQGFIIKDRKIENKACYSLKSYINKNCDILIKFPDRLNLGNTPLDIFHKANRYTLMNNLMALMQYQSPLQINNGIDLFIKLSRKMAGFMTKNNNIISSVISSEPNVKILESIFTQAIKNYFLYNNTVYPLFTKDDFNFKSKPIQLRLAILISGLLWMKKDSYIDNLIKQLGDMLYFKIRYIHHLKPIIENIQTLLIILTGFPPFPWISPLRYYFVTFCEYTAKAIGLQYKGTNAYSEKALERAMTNSCLNNFMLCISLNFGPCLTWSAKSTVLSSKLNNICKNTAHKVNLKESNTIYISNVVTCMFLDESCQIIYSLRILKSKYISNCSLDKVERLAHLIINELDQLRNRFINLTSLTLTCPIQLNLHNFILYIYHMLRFYAFVFRFYHNEYNINRDLYSDTYKSILIESKYVIEYISKLPYHFMVAFGITNIAQCIVFILKNKKYSNENLQPYVDLGISHLKGAMEYPRIQMFSGIMLKLISILNETMNEL